MDRTRRHNDDRWRPRGFALRIQRDREPTRPYEQHLSQVAVSVWTDFPVVEAAARGDGLDVNQPFVRRPQRFAIEKEGRDGLAALGLPVLASLPIGHRHD